MLFKKLPLLLAVAAATCAAAQTAHATTYNRTFVSNTGLAGNTSSGCSASAPCDTFAHALSVTSAGGEINCLNSGDFGTVTIEQAVTINCQRVANGGISAPGVTAITVSTSGPVNLIGLDLNGMNAEGGMGVYVQFSGTVTIRNCKIHGFLTSNGANGLPIWFLPTSSGGELVIDNVLATDNTYGITETSSVGSANMTVLDSNVTNISSALGTAGIEVFVHGGTHAGVTVERTTLALNGQYGLQVYGSGAVGIVGNSTVVNNTTGVNAANGGILYSFKNNQIGGNSTDGTPLTAYPGGPLN